MLKSLKKLRYTYVLILILAKNLFKSRTSLIPKETNTSIFFILGSGRNGSTLLARLLNNHSQIFLPPEQFALPYSIIDWHSSIFRNLNFYIKKQLNRYYTHNQNWILNTSDFNIIEKELEQLDTISLTPRSIFRTVLQHYSTHLGPRKNIVGDHSPLSTIFYKYIFNEFPEDKYIFLIRHPYDVILSYSKISNNPASNPSYACNKWNNSINAYDHLVKKGGKVLLVRYEDLVTKTDISLERILNFLAIDLEDLTNRKIENIEKSLGTKSQDHHKNLYNPVNSNSVNNWKENLDPEITSTLDTKLRKNALRFNYNLSR